jgi:hypothetical protein
MTQIIMVTLKCVFHYASCVSKDDNWAGSGRPQAARLGPQHYRAVRAGPHSRNQQPAPSPFTNRAARGRASGCPWAVYLAGIRAFCRRPAGFRSPRDWMERKSDLNPDQAPGPPPRLGLHQPDLAPIVFGSIRAGPNFKIPSKSRPEPGPNPVGLGRPAGHPAQLSSLCVSGVLASFMAESHDLKSCFHGSGSLRTHFRLIGHISRPFSRTKTALL